MAKYRCSVCGYIFDEEQEKKNFSELKECPVCHQPADKFYSMRRKRLRLCRKRKELETGLSEGICPAG